MRRSSAAPHGAGDAAPAASSRLRPALPAIEADGKVSAQALVGLRVGMIAAPAVARAGGCYNRRGAGFRLLSSLIPVNSRLRLPQLPLHCL
jgi:hypothetical protein